jgi:hypothetical protein
VIQFTGHGGANQQWRLRAHSNNLASAENPLIVLIVKPTAQTTP